MRIVVIVMILATTSALQVFGLNLEFVPYNEKYVCRAHLVGEIVISNTSGTPYDVEQFGLSVYVSHHGSKRRICVIDCDWRGQKIAGVEEEVILGMGTKIRVPVYIAIYDGEYVFPEPGQYVIQAKLYGPVGAARDGIVSREVAVEFVNGDMPEYLAELFNELRDYRNLCTPFTSASARRIYRIYIAEGAYNRLLEEYFLFQMGNTVLESYVRRNAHEWVTNPDYLRDVIDWNKNRTRYEWAKEWVIELFWDALDDHGDGRNDKIDELGRVSPRWR